MPPPYSKSRVDRAGRLLADQFTRVLEDPQRIRDPALLEDLAEAIDVVEWWRGEHAKPLSRVAANLARYVGQEGEPIVAQRLKRGPTIAGKLIREPAMKLSRMADVGGIRAIVPDQTTAYTVARRLQRNWTITRFRDYVAHPKSDGYRALHLINRHHGRMIEVQLRTTLQDEWANLVEKMSRTAFPGLKFGAAHPEVREPLRKFAEIMAKVDQEHILSFDEFKSVPEQMDKVIKLIEERS
jgi:putative GTP pyrophosphokinase